MKIIIGSKNPTKIQAVQTVFFTDTIHAINATSNVSSQPFSDVETRLGAMNRAKQCVSSYPEAFGIGLEGGVMYVEKKLYLCNWGALVTPEKRIFTASGARIPLPKEIEHELQKGRELGEVIDVYSKKSNVRSKEGTIGIFTNDFISRTELFIHIVKLLRGQLEFWSK